jgi:hypothetical protein
MVHLQMILNHLPGDPRHLRWLPGKHVHISPEEGDEHEFLFAVQMPCNVGGLGNICPNLNSLHGDVLFAEGCTRGADNEPRWRELEGARSGLPGPAAVSCCAARDWSFSSAETPASLSPRILRTPLGKGIFKTRYP